MGIIKESPKKELPTQRVKMFRQVGINHGIENGENYKGKIIGRSPWSREESNTLKNKGYTTQAKVLWGKMNH